MKVYLFRVSVAQNLIAVCVGTLASESLLDEAANLNFGFEAEQDATNLLNRHSLIEVEEAEDHDHLFSKESTDTEVEFIDSTHQYFKFSDL